jgi:hypothetical protein
MEKLPIEDIIKKYRVEYSCLRSVYSRAIGEKVYFNMFGFKHLIFKGKHRRENKTLFNRLILIPLIVPVIKNCNREMEIRQRYEVIRGKEVRVTYYALESKVGKGAVRVRVVTRKVGDKGKHYFQSIMKY